MLHTEASFSIYNVEDGCEDERKNEEAIERSEEFSFGGKREMGLVEEGDEEQDGFGGLNGIQTLSVQGEVGTLDYAQQQQQLLHLHLDLQVSSVPKSKGDATAPDSCNDHESKVEENPLFLGNNYFERAIQATPGDSNLLAAYATFLWETGEED